MYEDEEYGFCPECGALMKNGVCISCGYDRNKKDAKAEGAAETEAPDGNAVEQAAVPPCETGGEASVPPYGYAAGQAPVPPYGNAGSQAPVPPCGNENIPAGGQGMPPCGAQNIPPYGNVPGVQAGPGAPAPRRAGRIIPGMALRSSMDRSRAVTMDKSLREECLHMAGSLMEPTPICPLRSVTTAEPWRRLL